MNEEPAGPMEESHAVLARRLVAGTNRGALSTVGLEPPGYPFGSVATYALDPDGRPVVCMSTLAPHTQNVAADPRASLLVAEPVPDGTDPLAAARATLVGDLLPVHGEGRAAARELFLAANPAAAGYVDYGDFGFWRLEVRSVRFVGGYGRMSWVAPGDYATAGP